jgi:colanic acid biosynthesis glycosyl transferase WcaI
LGALLTLADVHLLPQVRDAADLVLPSKLGGMLSSGRPVIAGVDAGSEIAGLVRHCGHRVEPECAAGFAAAIEALCDDEAARLQLGRAARQLAQTRLGQQALLDGLSSELQALSGQPLEALPRSRVEA